MICKKNVYNKGFSTELPCIIQLRSVTKGQFLGGVITIAIVSHESYRKTLLGAGHMSRDIASADAKRR